MVALAEALGLASEDRSLLQELASASAAQPAGRGPELPAVPPQPAARVRLPVPPTALIGREADVAAAAALLDPARSAVRLLTLVGPGGLGKTRLALAVAAGLSDAYPDGVVFVDLAPLRDPRLVPATIARALDLRESGGRSARELLLAHLQERHLLLVLDNFEHLLGATPLLAELLAGCPPLALLVTSRAALRLRAEQRFRVAPLPTPDDELPSMAAIAASPAVRLFVERAQAVAPDFVLDAGNAPAVAAICRRLEGMPLAIELAAARVGLLRPEALLQRLEHRLPLLTGGAPDLRERQQTLRHTLAWSHDLLGLLERRLFRRLAVFAGGWTLDAAEAVCSDGDLPLDEVLERLGVLVDTSLVVRTIAADDEQRFGMLETIREFAAECLRIADEERDTHTRHLAFFLARAEAVEPALHGAAQANLANRLEREHDNLRAALTWSLHSAQVVVGLRLAVALRYFWKMHGHHREGRYWLRALVEASTTVAPPDLQGRALGALGYLEAMQADYASAQGHLEQALALGRAVADLQIVAFAQRYLGFTANARGDFDSARRSLEQSFGLYRELGLEHEAGAFSLYLGDTAFGLGDRERAERLFEESSVRLQHLQDTTLLPYPLRRLAQLALLRGDAERATQLCLESLALNRDVGDPQGIAACLVGLAAIAAATHRAARAAQLLGGADVLLASVQTQLLPLDQQQREQSTTRARTLLGASAFDRACNDGGQMGLEALMTDMAAPAAWSVRSPRPTTGAEVVAGRG